jgi:uncharacterized damage-inducible protein DinB
VGNLAMTPATFASLAAYNKWANQRLYEACGRLDGDDYGAPRPSFFGSIHATLNHILVGDRVWLARLEGRPSGITALDEILYADFAGLSAARAAEDERVERIVAGIAEPALGQPFAYRNMAGETKSFPLGHVLMHFFNHQTHHRGQVHGLLSATAVPPPSLDLILFLDA